MHTFLVMQGKVYVAGQGDSGQLGLGPRIAGAEVATCIPFPYDEFNIVHITAGIAHNGRFLLRSFSVHKELAACNGVL